MCPNAFATECSYLQLWKAQSDIRGYQSLVTFFAVQLSGTCLNEFFVRDEWHTSAEVYIQV